MINFNKYPYGCVEYFKEDLKERKLIADLVKEAVTARIKNGNNKTPLEELCVAVSIANDTVYSAEKTIKEMALSEETDNG